jgi:hypothetical protein
MTGPRLRLAAIAVGTLSLGLVVVGLVLVAMGAAATQRSGTAGGAILTLAMAGTPVVGLLVAVRRPQNRYGWLLLSFGFFTSLVNAAGLYATYGFAVHGPEHTPTLTAAMTEWILWPAMPLHLPLLMLYFPDGRLPSRRWRWLPVTLLVCGLLTSGLARWTPGELSVEGFENPYAAPGLLGSIAGGVIILVIAMFAANLPAAASMVLRWRRASGQLRLQLRWFTWAAAFAAVVIVGGVVGAFDATPVLNDAMIAISLTSLYAAIGVAVLRYRLYEIDRLVSRTVSYVLLSLLVVGVYLAVVTVLTRLTASVTGESPLAVAASTLAAAAVIGPARSRIQGVVDRRFNRARYDASRAVDSYRARMRDSLDVDDLSDDLLSVVRTTMEPTRAYLWLLPHKGVTG